jgi:predicted homoserine dehydrogenase-like protein
MIIFLLVAQVGEAFAVSSMACFNNERNLMMTEVMADVVEHDMSAEMNANDDTFGQTVAKTQMMEHECCQQECDCPIGMLSLVVLIELNIQAISHLTDDEKIDVDRRLVHAFIPSQKRPPKFQLILTA